MADRIQLRRDTAANWTAYNPILLEGEPGIEIDTDQWKLGDGVHTWSQLAYRGGECVQQRGQSTTVAMSQKAVTDELNLIGVFDISAHNLTDGQPTKYADLTAALGTNGANVPTQYRVPGMTVRYVQSSDNNYRRFDLIADEFTTDVTKWQGRDEKPTINSKNLVESGGVAPIIGTIVNNLTVNTIPASSRVGYVLPITDFDTKYVRVSNANGTRMQVALLNAIGFTSSFKVKVLYETYATSFETEIVIEQQYRETAKYIGVYYTDANSEYSFKIDWLGYKASTEENRHEIDTIWEYVDKIKTFDDEPLLLSENPVKSKGIKGAIRPLDEHFDYVNLGKYPINNGTINSTTQKWQNTTSKSQRHVIIPVSDLGGVGAKFKIKGHNANWYCFLRSYNPVDGQSADVVSMGKWSDVESIVTIPLEAVYLYAVVYTSTSGDLSPAIWYSDDINDIQKIVDEHKTRIESFGSCLFERKSIQSNAPYYLENAQNPSGYNDGWYLEDKVMEIKRNGQSFIFVTDTHLPRSANHSDIIISYIKKRCGINIGIFGGDCVDNNPTKYLAANVLTDYASDFFGIFSNNGLWVQGNHDSNIAAVGGDVTEEIALISNEEIYKRTVANVKGAEFDDKGWSIMEPLLPSADVDNAKWWWKMHYCKDDSISKTRFIVFESNDRSYGAQLFNDYFVQADFIADALNSVPNGYNVVVSCHQVGGVASGTRLPEFYRSSNMLMQLLSAYKMKTSVNITLPTVSEGTITEQYWQARNVDAGGSAVNTRTFDFSTHKGNCKVIAITGHFHNDVTFVGQTVNGSYNIERVCEHDKSSIPSYSSSESYTVGDEVVYNSEIYACLTDVTNEAFDSSKWTKLLDKDNLAQNAVYLLWRNRDAYNAKSAVGGVKTGTYNHMIANTVTEQSFDVVCFDANNLKITKVGAGENIELPLTL